MSLLISSAYFISDASTRKAIILESRRLEYLPIEHLRSQNPDEYSSRRWKIDGRYETQLSVNLLHREAGGWGIGIFGILLITLGIFDIRLHNRRYSQYQKSILAELVEKNIDSLLEKRNLESNSHDPAKWAFEKTIFIENVFNREDTGKLMFSKEQLLEMIDQIMDGTFR
ncbi:MAG: hypothetical protein GY852_05545 [bacterium]|nr:hypothetical protein [bacterium]